MKYRILGSTGLKVSEIGFGTWALGGDWGPTNDKESIKALRRAFDLGINFFDTADIYGQGKSEMLIAEALRDVYDEIIIATKVGRDFYNKPIRKRWDKTYINYAIDQSLKRLRTDTIDFCLLHNPPLNVIHGNISEILKRIKEEGKIKFYGASISYPKEGMEIIDSDFGVVLEVLYNILDQEADKELFPKAKKSNIGIIVRTPLAYGLLTGKFDYNTIFHQDDHRFSKGKKWLQEGLAYIKKFNFLAENDSRSMTQTALSFILANDAVSVVIPGMRTCEQVEENIGALNTELSPEEIEKIKTVYQSLNNKTRMTYQNYKIC